jgi:hypothetical protein
MQDVQTRGRVVQMYRNGQSHNNGPVARTQQAAAILCLKDIVERLLDYDTLNADQWRHDLSLAAQVLEHDDYT